MTMTYSNTTKLPLLLPPIPPPMAIKIPTSIVCRTCNEETGLTPESIMDMSIDSDICCPICGNVIYSCLPEKPIYSTGSHTVIYDNYD
jgi:hypothetical protein